MNHKLDTDTHVFFYEQQFYVLSNFSAFRLYWKGVIFDTSEHAYHWEKFPYPDQSLLRIEIQDAPSAHAALQLARKHEHEIRRDWKEVRVGIMEEILWEKVRQHEYVRRKLLQTGDRILVEDSWRDDFWGWGPDKNGANVLGCLWMKIRAQLILEENAKGVNLP